MERIGLTYNTEKDKITIPEYGRCIQEMIKKLPEIEDRQQRTEAALNDMEKQINSGLNFDSEYKRIDWNAGDRF